MPYTAIKDWRTLPDGREKYQVYLASREWAILKEAVRRRSGGTCEWCRSSPGTQTHHQTYERKYRERLDDLLHVCAPCHEFLSGKGSRDPRLDVPPTLFGRPIRSVYLAGKITGDNWRDEIVPDWSNHSRTPVDSDVVDCGDKWTAQVGIVPLPDGRSIAMTGPFWRDIYGGHGKGDIHQWAFSERNCGGIAEGSELNNLATQIVTGILSADLIFAWISTKDCFGTLVEIGYASSLKTKKVVVAFPDGFDSSDLWLATALSWNGVQRFTECESPSDPWRTLWTTEGLR